MSAFGGVVERRDTFPDLLRGKLQPSWPHAEGDLKHLDPVDQGWDGAAAVGSDDLDV